MTAPGAATSHALQYIGQVQGLRGHGLGLRLSGRRLARCF